MTATIAETLLPELDNWLKRVESTKEGDSRELLLIAVNALFTQISLIVLTLKTDPECWKEVTEFIR
jgi:ribosomal protein S1